MFHALVSRNDDIKRLVEKGYAIQFDSSHLVIRDIPYLDKDGALQIGAIVTKLTFLDQSKIGAPDDHQIFFCGSQPHNLDGGAIPNLGGGPAQLVLSNKTTVVERSFSNKPVNGFTNFFDKIESYVAIISGPATELHGAKPFTFRVDEAVVSGSPFKLHDTLTSRAELGELSKRLSDDVVAIIGLGGTGSYILDYIVKSPVKEVRAFDPDAYYIHNAFRSPGRLTEEELGKQKAEVYAGRYDNFRSGLSIHSKFVDASCATDVEGVTFAFVCVDNGPARAAIFDLLISQKIAFIDVGMGLKQEKGPLRGIVRTTYYSPESGTDVRAKGLADEAVAPDDAYRTNIQIAELNAINAAVAVIRYKQIRGFYGEEDSQLYQILLGVQDLCVAGESFA